MGEPPTLTEMALRLKIDRPDPGRWLRRYVQARERETGRSILVPTGGKARPTYRVHVAELRRACPELFDPREPMVQATRELVQAIRQRDERIDERLDDLEAIVGAVLERLRQLPMAS